MHVAQPAGAFFDVRLQVIGRVFEASIPLLLLETLGFNEVIHIEGLLPALIERMRIAARADDDAPLQKGGRNGYVGLRLADAFFNASHAVANLKAEIPRLA